MVSEAALESVVALTSHADSTDVANAAASLLSSIASSAPDLRQYLGRAGAVEYFARRSEELVSSDATVSLSHRYHVIDALCQCCRDANNRIKIRQQGGLSVLTDFLSNSKFTNIHDRIISAFVCFIYDDASIAVLLQNSLVPTLVSHLYRVAGITKKSDFMGLDSFDVCELLRTDLAETTDADPECLDNAYLCCDDLKSADDQPTCFSLDTGVKRSNELLSCDSSVDLGIEKHSPDNTAVLEALSTVGTSVLKADKLRADNNQTTVEFELLSTFDEPIVTEPNNVDACERTSRYSINSPTYKAVSAWRMELAADENDDSAHDRHSPRNIWEGARLYADDFSAPSPPPRPGSVSPTRSLGSYSDGLSSVRSWSSSLCDSSPQKTSGVSPARSLDSSGGGMYSPFSNSSYVSPDGACSPASFSDANAVPPAQWYYSDDQLEAVADVISHNQSFHIHSGKESLVGEARACLDESVIGNSVTDLPTLATTTSDIRQQNDDVGVLREFSLKVVEKNEPITEIRSEGGNEEELEEQCSDDEFDVESFQRKRQDERKFSRLLDIAKNMYASIETEPLLQTQQTKKRRRSSSGSASPAVSTREKFQCHDISLKTGNISCITGTLGAAAVPAKDLQNLRATNDVDSCAYVPEYVRTADDTDSGEIDSDTQSKVSDSDDVSECSVHRRHIGRVTARNILTLLSRISHSPETIAHVLNAGTICGLLDYALLASSPLPAAGRTLLRMSRSHHGFQRAVLCLFPVQAAWRMDCSKVSSVHSENHSNDFEYFCKCTSCARRTNLCVNVDSVDHDVSSDDAQSCKQQIKSSSKLTEIISESKNGNYCSCSLSCHVGSGSSSVESSGAERSQEGVTSKLCDEILANMSTIAVSGYGQGVVSHLLLRGSHSQRERCVMSLCFLCRFVFYVIF